MHNIYSFSDEQVLDFLCGVFLDHEEALLGIVQEKSKSGNYWISAEAAGVFVAVRAVVARLRWHGMQATPTNHECLGEDEYRRKPLLLDLPGLAGFFPFTDKQLLHRVSSFFYDLQQEIFDSVLPSISGRKRLILAQAMALAEKGEEREGAVDTELTGLRTNELSKWQRIIKETVESLNRPSATARQEVAS